MGVSDYVCACIYVDINASYSVLSHVLYRSFFFRLNYVNTLPDHEGRVTVVATSSTLGDIATVCCLKTNKHSSSKEEERGKGEEGGETGEGGRGGRRRKERGRWRKRGKERERESKSKSVSDIATVCCLKTNKHSSSKWGSREKQRKR